jgi:thiamine biosynthesis lipoprotein
MTAAPPTRRWYRRAQPGLGTLVEIAVLASSEAEFMRASDRAFARIAAFHAAMSFHEPGSDLAAIAAAPAGTTVCVAAETWQVLRVALALEAESDGLFNVAVAPRLVARGALPAPRSATRVEALAGSAGAALQLESGSRVHVRNAVWIDLGGIAKGAAVDAALAAIRSEGAVGGRVHAGGDIAVYGADAQPIRVRGPAPARLLVDAGLLRDGAIATSAPGEDATQPAPLVLPAGRTARWGDRSVSVVAPSCLVADALTKVLAALGPGAAPLLGRHDASGFSVDVEGRLERVG